MCKQFTAAIVWVMALASSACYDPNRIVAPDEVLLLTASPEAIPANGFSTSRVTARITTDVHRTVTISFTSAGGTLPSTTTLSPDSNGEASIFLTSETVPKTATVTAEVKEGTTVLASRTVTVRFDAASPDSLIRLSTSASQIEADGVSSIVVRAEVNPSISPRTVSFKTTDGSFVRDASPAEMSQDNVATGADGVAQVQLFAPKTAGTALVSATAGGFSASQTVSFVPALPDFISLSANPLTVSIANGPDAIEVVAKLSRSKGTVSKNVRIEFIATNDATGDPIGRFEQVTRSDDAETAKAQFVPGTSAATGLATITARVADNNNVLARIKVNVTP
jgi:hypothetical protein